MARTRTIPLALIVVPMALVFLGGSAFVFVKQRTGERTKATVTECHHRLPRFGGIYCEGTWIRGGSLLEGGRVVRGTIDGADTGDLGKTLDVRLSGDRAYTTSLRLPIVLAATGLAVALLGAYEVFRTPKRRSGSRRAASWKLLD